MNQKILAQTNKIILIEGETGVGKSFLAKEIHYKSHFKSGEFVQVNLGAISDNLFEAELFGSAKGSYTGSISDKKGFVGQAHMGTLFLDEIGELSLNNQTKLLTFIDSMSYYNVGQSKLKKFTGKIITATNKNLEHEVSCGRFRKDLFFRLRFFYHAIKPLRSEVNIDEIIWNEINNAKLQYNQLEFKIDPLAFKQLVAYSWPGNYRELKQTIEYLFELKLNRITKNDIPSWILGETNKQLISNSACYKSALAQFEYNFLVDQMKNNEGKINQTALRTGISKVTLISKLKKYGIDRREYKLMNTGT